MSLLQEIVFVANNSKALKDIKQIEAEVKKLESLGESAIKINIDKDGITRVFSTLKSDTGAVVNLVRSWNAETKSLEEKSSSVAYNYEKIEKSNAKIESEAKRLLAQEDALARKTAERERKEKEIAELRERQASHNQRQRELELTFGNYDEYIKNLNLTEEQLEKMGLASDKTKEKTEQLGKQADKTGGQFTLLNTIFLRVAHTLLSTVISAFREAITEMKNVDTQLTTISRVTQTNIADLENLKNKAYEVGSAYGVMASDYLSAAAAFSRAGYREQAEDLAELSSKMQVAGQVSAETANQMLIATDKAYGYNGSITELSSAMDKMTVIDHNFATSVEKLADGMGIVAPVAKQANMSIDELIASLGTITAVTQRSGTEAARALRALILSIIKDTTTELDDGVTWTVEEINSVQDALKLYAPEVVKAAEATGKLIDPMEAIAALAKSYEEGLLTEAKLAQITSSLGGKLRASQLLSLIQNYSGMYTDMLNQMQTATGAVDKDIEKSLESWEVKIKQLKNTFAGFVQKSLSSNLFKGLLDTVKWLVDGFGSLGTAVAIFGARLIALKLPTIIDYFKNLTIAANGLNIAVGLLTVAVSAIVIALNKYNQSLDDKIGRGAKAYDELKSLEELETKYKNLKEQYEKGEISEEEYAKGKDEVIKKLDEEGVWVDTVTGKYITLESKIQGAINASKAYKLIEIEDAIKAAEKKANGFWTKDAVGYSSEAKWADYYLNNGTHPFLNANFSGYSIEQLVSMYDAAVKRREELYAQGSYGTKEDIALKNFISVAGELVSEYKDLIKIRDELNGVTTESPTIEEELTDNTEDATESVKGLTEELKKATDALDKYNEAIKGGEKGDTFRSYADAYKKAVEMYEKGLTGSTAYMSAIDLLFDSGIVNSYEEAGKLLGNEFIKAMFEGGGEDFGANAANYIREHLDEFRGVAIQEANDGTFSLLVTDMEAFATSANISEDALWALMDALDGFSSEELDGTQRTLDELEDNEHDIEFTSNLEEFESEAKKTFEELDNTIINVKFHGSFDYSTFGGGGGGGKFAQVKQHEATGTKSATGGATLVNEEGAELIYANGSAWVAGGGQPVITDLPQGAGVFNARDTRAILTRSGIPSFAVGIPPKDWLYDDDVQTRATASRIRKPDTRKKKATTESLQSLLEQISEYITEILKKAKDALQEQLDVIDEQIDKLKREHDAEEDATKLEELRLKILEAEKKLAEAEQERTVRYFNKETGQWEWMADQKAVAEAKKALEDAQKAYDDEVAKQEYEAQIQALKDQKESLQEAYSKLEDNWGTILESLQSIVDGKGNINIQGLLGELAKTSGGNYSGQIQELIGSINGFSDSPTSALDSATASRILSAQNGIGGSSSVLSAMLGSGSYDLNGKGQSTIGGNTSIVGDTIYYINGVQIGSDMMNKPLSQILSVLPIYAN